MYSSPPLGPRVGPRRSPGEENDTASESSLNMSELSFDIESKRQLKADFEGNGFSAERNHPLYEFVTGEMVWICGAHGRRPAVVVKEDAWSGDVATSLLVKLQNGLVVSVGRHLLKPKAVLQQGELCCSCSQSDKPVAVGFNDRVMCDTCAEHHAFGVSSSPYQHKYKRGPDTNASTNNTSLDQVTDKLMTTIMDNLRPVVRTQVATLVVEAQQQSAEAEERARRLCQELCGVSDELVSMRSLRDQALLREKAMLAEKNQANHLLRMTSTDQSSVAVEALLKEGQGLQMDKENSHTFNTDAKTSTPMKTTLGNRVVQTPTLHTFQRLSARRTGDIENSIRKTGKKTAPKPLTSLDVMLNGSWGASKSGQGQGKKSKTASASMLTMPNQVEMPLSGVCPTEQCSSPTIFKYCTSEGASDLPSSIKAVLSSGSGRPSKVDFCTSPGVLRSLTSGYSSTCIRNSPPVLRSQASGIASGNTTGDLEVTERAGGQSMTGRVTTHTFRGAFNVLQNGDTRRIEGGGEAGNSGTSNGLEDASEKAKTYMDTNKGVGRTSSDIPINLGGVGRSKQKKGVGYTSRGTSGNASGLVALPRRSERRNSKRGTMGTSENTPSVVDVGTMRVVETGEGCISDVGSGCNPELVEVPEKTDVRKGVRRGVGCVSGGTSGGAHISVEEPERVGRFSTKAGRGLEGESRVPVSSRRVARMALRAEESTEEVRTTVSQRTRSKMLTETRKSIPRWR